MYDSVFTINFFGNSSSPNPSFISFYLQDAPPNGSMDSVEDVFLFSKPVILWPGQQLFGVPMMSSQRPQSNSGAALFSIPQVLSQHLANGSLPDSPFSIARYTLGTLDPWFLTLRLSHTITHEHHYA